MELLSDICTKVRRLCSPRAVDKSASSKAIKGPHKLSGTWDQKGKERGCKAKERPEIAGFRRKSNWKLQQTAQGVDEAKLSLTCQTNGWLWKSIIHCLLVVAKSYKFPRVIYIISNPKRQDYHGSRNDLPENPEAFQDLPYIPA